MATSGKIRILLALLCAILIFTTIIVKKTYTPVNNLYQTAKTLEDNLRKKETYVNDFVNNKTNFNRLKELPGNPTDALNLIKDFTTDNSTWFITLNKNKLSFWSGIKIIPDNPGAINEGISFQKEPNGYYEAIKKSEGTFSVIFFIPVKLNYQFQNQYLQNTFATDLVTDDNIELAGFNDKNVYEIHSSNNIYLFSVKLKPGQVNHTFFYFELIIWILTFLSLCVLAHNICSYIAGKGYLPFALFVLAAFIVLIRFINLRHTWPDFTYGLQIFDPKIYNRGYLFPSFGDFCINILLIFWFTVFLYNQRNRLLRKIKGKIASYTVLIVGVVSLIVISTWLVNVFYDLVVYSKISFEINNVLNLSFFSFLGILMLCFSFLLFYLLDEVFLTISIRLPIPNFTKTLFFIIAIVLATIIAAYFKEFTLFYLLWGTIALIRAYAHRYKGARLNSASYALIVLICALISSIKLNYFESVNEKKVREVVIKKLERPDDSTAKLIFKKIESQITNDTVIKQYFKEKQHDNDYIKNRLQKLYFNGYLTKYDFFVYEFDDQDRPFSSDKRYGLGIYKDMVMYTSFKVSEYFYKQNDSFAELNYFAILPIREHEQNLGTIVIALKSKPTQSAPSFPGLLIDGQVINDDDFNGYSFAYYVNNKLVRQKGNYAYDLVNNTLHGEQGKYIFKTTTSTDTKWYSFFITHSHLIYKPSKNNLLVVSKEKNVLFFDVTLITFFFVAFLLFSLMVLFIRWLWLRIKIFNIKNNKLRWSFKINFDQVPYKTRIQFSMVFTVVITLILVGVITFYSISTQYHNQQDKDILDKITRIAGALEDGATYTRYLTNINGQSEVDFIDFANANSADLILYSLNGIPLLTTQPKIYDFGLQSRRMNARAYINLEKRHRSEFINDEIIGKLSYRSAFVPLRISNKTVAYLQLPYFSNEAEYKERIGSLLNIMINVYALIFIAIGLLAVIIAQQITAPLSFIQYSLSKTMYGKKNEPIQWDRDDEIGALVKEYNKMIAALEESAQRLAQSERESAWREMAKQVAHEIKNPLTPLKLGLQLLDKSWRDKDPKFDQKFERFSKSFVEQIESLSSIASEFSAFAKMPDTRIEKINVFGILGQAITIFKQMDNIKILYDAPEDPFFINADRDQLLRCFNNLLKNAIEAAPTDKMGVIEIHYLITSKNILLTIKDNGHGIPEALREKIFEPNFTTKSSGTGLGLAFVKNSIENAGGKVWFETKVGEGTTFYFSLPSA